MRRSMSAHAVTSRACTPRHSTGEITGFTGVADPYEPPASPDLRIATGEEPGGERLPGAERSWPSWGSSLIEAAA